MKKNVKIAKEQEKKTEKGLLLFLECMAIGFLALVAAVPVSIYEMFKS